MPETKTDFDTKTFMLPDWAIDLSKRSIDESLLFADNNLAQNLPQAIGHLQGTLRALRTLFDTAKPTKQETFYGGE